MFQSNNEFGHTKLLSTAFFLSTGEQLEVATSNATFSHVKSISQIP